MWANTEARCGSLDLSLPPFPERSRLHSLEPVGLGTAGVESLTGYFSRLAEAHGNSPAALFGREIAPLMKSESLRRRAQGRNKSMLLAYAVRSKSHAMNGTGGTARDWAEVLGDLTKRTDLRLLTMLPWTNVLSHPGLIRPVRAWCPSCYEEWRLGDEPVYEPLLWSLEVVGSCLRHRLHLRTICSHCGRRSHALESRSRPGFCHACLGWLGASHGKELSAGVALEESECEWQEWVSSVIGEMLSAAPGLFSELTKEGIARSTSRCVEYAAPKAGVAEFCDALGLSKDAICNWVRGKSRVHLGVLLKICHGVGISPLEFLTGTLDFPKDEEEVVEAGSEGTVPSKASGRRWRALNLAETEKRLKAALREEPPPSMIEMERRLGRSTSTLRYRFPELCAAIVKRYADHVGAELSRKWRGIRRKLKDVLKDESCPSVSEVARRHGWHLSTLIETFPDLCLQITERNEEYVRRGRETVGAELTAILKECPPPPMCAVAVRLNRSEQSLYDHFPVLCKRIAARYLKHLRVLRGTRREQFLAELREVALRLHGEGIYPSVRRVEANLSEQRSLRSNREALAVLRGVCQELKLAPRRAPRRRVPNV